MESFLNDLYSNSAFPLLSAFILGLMTAISPCPLATNITAIGFVSKDIENRRRVFMNGLIYTLGRTISYTGLAFVLYLGADQFNISGLFQQYGERFLGPLMLLAGLLLLDYISMHIPGLSFLNQRFEQKSSHTYWDVLVLGMVFALAFCPYSGVLYFGVLIPMTISSLSGMYLPVVFAIATGIPVIILAWLIAFAYGRVGRFYEGIKSFEKWFRRLVALLFIGIGIYYIIVFYF